MKFRDLLDISQFPKILSLKAFSNSRGNSCIPYFILIIRILSLVVKGKFGKTSKSLKIL